MTLTEQVTIPNLEGMTEIEAGELEQLSRDLTRLARYAGLKASAIRNRLAGKVELAMLDEQDCEELYDNLPKDWRW